MKKILLTLTFLCTNGIAALSVPTPTPTPTPVPTATPTPAPTPLCDPENDGDDECIEHNLSFEQCEECLDNGIIKKPKKDDKKKEDKKKDYDKKKKDKEISKGCYK
jgi:hypothetical protein